MKYANRFLAIILSIVLLISAMPVFANAASAYDFADFPAGTWSEEAMLAAVNNGLLTGRGDGTIAPKSNLTRAEAAAIINRAFGATVKADVSAFNDVSANAWYYEDVQKAVNMGTFVGASSNSFAPESYITRESMLTVLARALVLSDASGSSLFGFSDGASVSSWASAYVNAMAKRGYVNGNGNGNLNPQGYITREEFAQVMHNIFKVYISNSGDVKNVTYATTIIRAPDVNLENVVINGDLVFGDGVGKGDVTLKDVKVTGRILFRGGEGKVHFVSGCTVGEHIIVHDVNGTVNFNNYKTDAIFKGIQLDTSATFLKKSFGGGGGGGSSKPVEKYYTVTFNGKEYDVKRGEKISTNTELADALKDVNATGYTTTYYLDGVEKTLDEILDYKPTGDVTITYVNTELEDAKLYFKHYFDGDALKVDVRITKIPEDIKDIAAISFIYSYDNTKMSLKDAKATFAGTFEYTDTGLSWYSANAITAAELLANANTLFTLTFDVIPTAEGFAEFKFVDVTSLADSELKKSALYETEDLMVEISKSVYVVTFNGATYDVVAGSSIATNTNLAAAMEAVKESGYETKYYANGVEIDFSYVPTADVTITYENTEIVIPTEYYKVTFNGNDYDVEKGKALSTNGSLTAAMEAVKEAGYETKYYANGVEIDLTYVPTADVTITYENEKIIVNHTVRLYSGVKNDYNYRGEYIVESGDKLTQAQIDAYLGDPSTYNVEKGYTDSDGKAHEITPELWYNNGKEWVLYDVSMPITQSMDICLLTRYIKFTYDTNLSVKGIDVPATTITVAYNEDTNVTQTVLDIFSATRRTLGRNLELVKSQGYDVYQMAIDKAASTGLVDTDGNILNPEIAVPLNKFITEGFISDEIDTYIDDNIGNDDFIADLVSNDHVHQMLLESEGLRVDLLTNTNSKSLIKENILKNKYDPTLKADIKTALKEIVKGDKVALLEDTEILNTFTAKVNDYLDAKGITYVTASEIVDAYKNDSLDVEHNELYDDIIGEFDNAFNEKYDSYFDTNYIALMNEHFDKYFDDTVVAYINYTESNKTLTKELKTYIDEKLTWYEEKLIADFISGEDRTLLHEAIPHYAHTAVEAIKTTDAYKGPIADFVSGNDVRVNEENIVFIEILSTLIHTYDYEKLSSHVLPEKIKTAIDKLGKDVAEKYVEKYLEVFTEGMDTAIDNLNQDLNADIKDTEYSFSTKPAVRINYVEDFVVNYYNKLMPKVREKLYSQSKLDFNSNPYAKRLIDMDIISLYLDKGKSADEVYSGYALKDDILDYYDVRLELLVLMHDAIVWYDDIESQLDALSSLTGRGLNKINSIITEFINTGSLPKGFTLEDILNKSAKVEDLYERFEDKIEKVYDLYENYLDRDYTDIIDFANISVYADGNRYKLYQLILEDTEDAFDVDNMISAVFDKANYHGVSQLSTAMSKVKSKLNQYRFTPEEDEFVYVVDAYKATLDSKTIKGHSTGDHTVELHRYLRYFND